MKRASRVSMLAVGAGALAAMAMGAAALADPVDSELHRPGVYCPDVYAPVLCPNGRVYSNSCWASVAGQKNCVPWGAVTE